MGLNAPKKRAKLSHDPNNTAWARNTESFGHKILSSQGWTPGQTLGADGAAHAEHYTAGSNSHIRVLLKDDQLGLGAKRGGNNAETFGLSLFSGILGRLNGKSEVQLEKEQSAQRDVELALYQSRKGGYVNFVSAGFLVGDRIDKAELMKKEDMEKAKKNGTIAASTVSEEKSSGTPAESQGTKRKRGDAEAQKDQSEDSSSSSSEDEAEEEEEEVQEEKTPKSKKSAKSGKQTSTDDSESTKAKKSDKKKSKKDKKSKSSSANSSDDEARAAKKARKVERRAEKEARRAERQERRKRKEAKRAAKSGSTTPASGSVTPQAAVPFIGRHAVRQRYIAAKGRAHLDPQALKEVCDLFLPAHKHQYLSFVQISC